MNQLTPDDFQRVADALDKMTDAPIDLGPDIYFANKPMFFAIQDKKYFVIGTRLIINPIFNRHSNDDFFDLFYNTDLTHAQFFSTRNAAKRAVARNRQGIPHKEETNETTAMVCGIKCVLTPASKFYEDIYLGQ